MCMRCNGCSTCFSHIYGMGWALTLLSSTNTRIYIYIYGFSWFFHGFSLFFMVCLLFFHGFFKELDFKELEIHRYSLLDTTNEYQWKSINEYQWISINEFIDGPSMNMVPFLWFPFLWALLWAPWPGSLGRAQPGYVVNLEWCLARPLSLPHPTPPQMPPSGIQILGVQ